MKYLSKFIPLLLLAFILYSFDLNAQYDEEAFERIYYGEELTPGDYLIKFTNTFYIGFGIQIVGAGFYIATQFADNPQDQEMKQVALLGGMMFVVGSIVQAASFSIIGRAGSQLNKQQFSKDQDVSLNIGITKDGIGIVCRF